MNIEWLAVGTIMLLVAPEVVNIIKLAIEPQLTETK